MRKIKQIDIKNRTYYFYNDMMNLEDFDSDFLKISKKLCKNIGIFNIGYVTIEKFDDWERSCSVNPLYLRVSHANGYIEEKNENKYLIFDTTDKNKELLKKDSDIWSGVKNKIKEAGSCECDYKNDYMKIEFNSDDDLPLNKPLKFHMMTIIIRSVFEDDGELYPQDFLDDALYELNMQNVNCKKRIKC